jgi:predicted MPP superfamily phosphohydrolase
MRGVPAGACALLLSHTPDIVLRLGPHRPGLVLSGHTHGGQVRLPLVGPVFRMTELPRSAVMGLHLHDGVPVYVTSGIGYAGIDLRIDCPPEVALLSLKAAPD